MTISREEAKAELRAAAEQYDQALAKLADAESIASKAAFRARTAGISQHDIATIMGERWAKEHNPQYPPVLNLNKSSEDEE